MLHTLLARGTVKLPCFGYNRDKLNPVIAEPELYTKTFNQLFIKIDSIQSRRTSEFLLFVMFYLPVPELLCCIQAIFDIIAADV